MRPTFRGKSGSRRLAAGQSGALLTARRRCGSWRIRDTAQHGTLAANSAGQENRRDAIDAEKKQGRLLSAFIAPLRFSLGPENSRGPRRSGGILVNWKSALRDLQFRPAALHHKPVARKGIKDKRPHARKEGFSLIELMVVLVLIGIMAAVIIPEMKGAFEDALLRSTARKLVAVFNLAGSQAVTVNQLHRVRLDRKTGRYFLERSAREGEQGSRFVPVRDVAGGEGELDTRISIEMRRPVTDASGPGDQEGRLVADGDVQNPNQGEALSFYADGTADAGEILLRDREGFRLALQINPTTAQIRIVELERE